MKKILINLAILGLYGQNIYNSPRNSKFSTTFQQNVEFLNHASLYKKQKQDKKQVQNIDIEFLSANSSSSKRMENNCIASTSPVVETNNLESIIINLFCHLEKIKTTCCDQLQESIEQTQNLINEKNTGIENSIKKSIKKINKIQKKLSSTAIALNNIEISKKTNNKVITIEKSLNNQSQAISLALLKLIHSTEKIENSLEDITVKIDNLDDGIINLTAKYSIDQDSFNYSPVKIITEVQESITSCCEFLDTEIKHCCDALDNSINNVKNTVIECCISLEESIREIGDTREIKKNINNQSKTVEHKLAEFTRITEEISKKIENSLEDITIKIDDLEESLINITKITNTTSVPLCNNNVVNTNITLLIPGLTYKLTEDIIGNIIIIGNNSTVNLNNHTLTGFIQINADNATIKKGKIKTPSPASLIDSSIGAITISNNIENTHITDCFIECLNTTMHGIDGRNGIISCGTKTTIKNCIIIGGSGGSTQTMHNAGNGGNAIYFLNAKNSEIKNCTIFSTGNGGDSVYHNGGNAGNGIYIANSNNISIKKCTVSSTGSGGNGKIGGNGGDGIKIEPNALNTEVRFCTIANIGKAGIGKSLGTNGIAINDLNRSIISPGNSIIFSNFAYALPTNTMHYKIHNSDNEAGISIASSTATLFSNVFA